MIEKLRKALILFYEAIFKILSKLQVKYIYPIKLIDEFFMSLIRENFAEVLGHKMFLDKDSLRLSINNVYEPFQTDLVNR
jgi:hypothetical protein